LHLPLSLALSLRICLSAQSPEHDLSRTGRTGERVSAIGLGGYHLGKQQDPNESIRLLRAAIDRGITFMDNCWTTTAVSAKSEWPGASRWLPAEGLSDDKDRRRDKNTAARQIEQSLGRLQTDVIDLLQFHEVIRLDDPDVIFAPGGALEAVEKQSSPAKSVTLASLVIRIQRAFAHV